MKPAVLYFRCLGAQRAFLRGGIWDSFFAKYPESNLMHKKAMKVSSLVRTLGPDEEALRRLLMAQTNCPYWHGLFGGIYISSLRHAVYANLLEAESLIDGERFSDQAWRVELTDHNLDGTDEILAPARGSTVRGRYYRSRDRRHGLDSPCGARSRLYSYSNILMRRRRIYHRRSGNHTAVLPAGAPGPGAVSIHDIQRG